MNLTREQTIEEHRKLWNWIADETERLKRKVLKEEYFYRMGIEEWPENWCYCCEYDHNVNSIYPLIAILTRNCSCPIQWSQEPDCDYCTSKDSPYRKWHYSKTYEEAAKYAREIANLPEREDIGCI